MIVAWLVLALALLIPGWFCLALTGARRAWTPLQLWLTALGIGLAFYPVLFYAARAMLPFFTFGPYKITALLVGMALVTAWRLRTDWRKLFAFAALEWVALGVFALTLGTRFWIVRDRPYPAWSDSLHHALLTHLTAVQGRLPVSLEPYYPIPLDQYHLGFYALTAVTQWLAQVPAHTALLVTAQAVNGLAGIGVYLVLERKVGRVGAIVGAVIAGLLSQQPALYVNWGRFTQLSSQALLLIGWLAVWESLDMWASATPGRSSSHPESDRSIAAQPSVRQIYGLSGIAALITAAIFLLHFRVAAFYLPLLAITTGWVVWRVRRDRMALRRTLTGVALIASLSLLLVIPALVGALRVYLHERLAVAPPVAAQGATFSTFYTVPFDAVPYLIGLPWWFLALTAFAALIGIMRRNSVVLQTSLWLPILLAMGYVYLLGIPLLNLTNLGAVLIMLYLPIALIVGAAVEVTAAWLPRPQWVRGGLLGLCLLTAVLGIRDRTLVVEPFRYFVTTTDVTAMAWIAAQTPADAHFAVNTHFWLPRAPHGTDGGYWIPYFTGRTTTAGVMINNLGAAGYQASIVEQSRAVERLQDDPSAVDDLRRLGVTHVYIGPIGHYLSAGLDPARLRTYPGLAEVYTDQGVTIFALEHASP